MSTQIQDILFQRIREKLPASASLVDVVASKLYVSNNSAYRRIRGETLLVLDEAALLCSAFDISLDQLLQQLPGSVSFKSFTVDSSHSFEDYLKGIISQLKLASHGIKREIVFMSKDIPFFYDFLYSPLSEFRYFCWMKSIVQDEGFSKAKFKAGMMPDNLKKMAMEAARLYSVIPSIEIWNSESINSTIAQIEYYRDAGYFHNSEDIDEIYRALEHTIHHIRTQAEYGCKFLPHEKAEFKGTNYQLFFNRLILGDNTVLLTIDGRRTVFINYDVLNYMQTENTAFCNAIKHRLDNLMKKATLISQANEKQRNRFFNLLLKKFRRELIQ